MTAEEILLSMTCNLSWCPCFHKVSRNSSPITFTNLLQPQQEELVFFLCPRNTSFAFSGSTRGVNDVIGYITGIGGVGILWRWLFILREVGHASTFSERVVDGVVGCGGGGGVGVVVSSGESNTKNHDAFFFSTVVACSRVVAVVAAL